MRMHTYVRNTYIYIYIYKHICARAPQLQVVCGSRHYAAVSRGNWLAGSTCFFAGWRNIWIDAWVQDVLCVLVYYYGTAAGKGRLEILYVVHVCVYVCIYVCVVVVCVLVYYYGTAAGKGRLEILYVVHVCVYVYIYVCVCNDCLFPCVLLWDSCWQR